jgi:hypothetical protein
MAMHPPFETAGLATPMEFQSIPGQVAHLKGGFFAQHVMQLELYQWCTTEKSVGMSFLAPACFGISQLKLAILRNKRVFP